MREDGIAEDEIAKGAHQARRDLGQQFKDNTDPALREVIYKRNLKVYGDPLGPKYEDLKRGYRIDDQGNHIPIGKKGTPKTDAEIIQGAMTAGGADFPWVEIAEFGRAKDAGDADRASLLLLQIDARVNPPRK